MWRFCHFNSNWFRDRKGLEMTKKNIDTTTMGGRIKKLRRDRGLSQEELAGLLHLENKASVSSYETNRRGISGDLAIRLAEVLCSSVSYILNGDDETDDITFESIELLKKLRSDAVKQAALKQIKALIEMEKLLEG